MVKTIIGFLSLFVLPSCGKCLNLDKQPGMCAKLPMAADGIVRLSKVEVYPEYLDEYMKYATEVGEISLRTEPGVLTMYAVSEKENPRRITILETYASRLRIARCIGAFSEIQTGNAAYGQDARALRPDAAQPSKPHQ